MYFEHPLPFYVAYPFTSFYDDEKTARKDMEIMKSYYPKASIRIQQLVEKECDRMEYDGSMMYDEYPDPLMVTQICRRISEKIRREGAVGTENGVGENGSPESGSEIGGAGRTGMKSTIEPELLEIQERYRAHSTALDDLVRILFCHEMFERRCRRRRARRYF